MIKADVTKYIGRTLHEFEPGMEVFDLLQYLQYNLRFGVVGWNPEEECGDGSPWIKFADKDGKRLSI